ncbi:MAG: DNA cytosine methyltransferase [Candidatus Lokiarchaeota archaeon]|nr:DNA cytosine methyltransferase [Candidatus Lokiarchaeota archaeon]
MSEKKKILIDLFCGAGGLSLGFELANFRIRLAIELEENYYRAYKRNHSETLSLNEDITLLNCEEISEKYLKNKEIDGIIGGPPCIGFSTVGNRRPDDPRNMLIFYFIQWVKYFKPKFFVMENVPGILSMGKGKVVEKVVNLYKEIGYNCKMEILLAADYGVPQLRQRIFFIGTQGKSVYSLKIQKTNKNNIVMKSDLGKNALPSYLTVQDALSDILKIKPLTKQRVENSTIIYNGPPLTQYQEYLRENSNELYDHFAPNHSEIVERRISLIDQGMNHSSLPKEFQLKGGYPNIYGRLHLKYPADTITGNCGCVSAPGRFIHPTQNRAISIREAARLQSFPDRYKFCGTMREKYKQVGNAVPPLMAYVVAKSIKNIL